MRKPLAMTGIGLILLSQALLAETVDSSTDKSEAVTATVGRESAKTGGYFALPVGENLTIPATYIEEMSREHQGNILILSENENDINGQHGVVELRTQLPESGWSTMTIALDYSAEVLVETKQTSPDKQSQTNSTSDSTGSDTAVNAKDNAVTSQSIVSNVARIAGAKAYLQARQPGNLIIIAVGRSDELLIQHPELLSNTNAVVFINATLAKPNLPDDMVILDIFSTRPATYRQLAKQRQAVFKRQDVSRIYSQRLLEGANRQFQGFETILMATVRGWLATLPTKDE